MFVLERCNESVRLGLLVQGMQALAAGLRLAAAHYRERTLQPTPQVRNGMYITYTPHLLLVVAMQASYPDCT